MRSAAIRRVCAAVTVCLLGVSLATGCATASASRSSKGLEKTNLTIGAIQSSSAAGLYIAQERGLFAAQGLHVKIIPTVGSGPTLPYLLGGTWDISFGNYVSFFLAQAAHIAKLHILAEGYVAGKNEFEVIAPRDSGIASPQDLRGKKIGVNALNNVATLVVSSALKNYGVPPSSVSFVPIPFPQMGAALQTHKIDAGWLNEPYLTQAEQKFGTKVVFDSDQGATTNFPISGYVVTDTFAKKYPKTAAAFARAIVQAQGIASSDHTAVQQALPHFTTITAQTAQVIAIGTYPTTTDALRLQRVSDLMSLFSMLKQPLDVRTMIG